MSAKLARLEQQELEFLAKYGKKSQTPNAISGETISNSAALSPLGEEPEMDEGKGKKKKKKKKKNKMSEDKAERVVKEDGQATALPETDELAIVPEKRRKRSKEKSGTVAEGQLSIPRSTKKSCKKKKRSVEEETSIEQGGNCEVKEGYVREGSTTGENAFPEPRGEHALIPEVNKDKKAPKKKKRTKNKVAPYVETAGDCSNGVESNVAETVPKKKRKVHNDANILQLEQEEEPNAQPVEKIKKKRACKGQEKVDGGEEGEVRPA